VTIELLYIAGCPNYRAVQASLRDALTRVGANDEIVLNRIATAEQAHRERFLGSPTVRIDGRDIDPDAGARVDYGLKCRLYRSGEDTTGVPPADWIVAEIDAAARRDR
jgi:hypothetical protein